MLGRIQDVGLIKSKVILSSPKIKCIFFTGESKVAVAKSLIILY
jgi:hypothetical protein